MSLPLRTPKVLTWRFRAAEGPKPEPEGLRSISFSGAMAGLLAYEAEGHMGSFHDRFEDFKMRLDSLRRYVAEGPSLLYADVLPRASKGQAIGEQPAPATHHPLDAERVGKVRALLEDIEAIAGEPAGTDSLLIRIQNMLADLYSGKQRLTDSDFVANLRNADAQAAKVLQGLELLHVDAIFKPSDVSAICAIYDRAQHLLTSKPIIHELSQCIQHIEQTWEDEQLTAVDFITEIEKIEATLDATDALVEHCLSDLFPQLLAALRALQRL